MSSLLPATVRALTLTGFFSGLVLFGHPELAHAQPAEPAASLPQKLTEPTSLRVILLPTRFEGADLAELAAEVDSVLMDATLDLGMSAERPRAPVADRSLEHLNHEARAFDEVVIAAELSGTREAVQLTLARASQKSDVIEIRAADTTAEDVGLRAAVLLRDLVRWSRPTTGTSPEVGADRQVSLAGRPFSAGRLVLAGASTAFGGLVGFSLQKSSGSDDPRLLYPLMAVGAGVGLGASLLAAEEWDVRPGDAWFMASAAFWPTLGGHLIYAGRFAEHQSESRAQSEQFSYGLVGGTTGVVLGTLTLTLGHMTEGDAVLAHSGGALGTVTGGLLELVGRRDLELFPEAGIGYGASFGWLVASAVAVQVDPQPSQILAMDVGAVLGGLAGASLASPLVIDDPEPEAQQAWAGITAAATLVGAAAGIWLSWPESDEGHAAASHTVPIAPTIVWIDGDRPGDEDRILGLGAQGIMP